MTDLQEAQLQNAKDRLLLYALLYARISVERDDASTAEDKLFRAAKQFALVVDSIDPNLWDTPVATVSCASPGVAGCS